MADLFDLERFVTAQDPLIQNVRRELSAGQKLTHWMWFVFPQLRALARSPTAQRYGISSLAEAQAYLAHSVLRERLLECTELVMAIQEKSVHAIFGSPDDLKFRSSMTLFMVAEPQSQIYFYAVKKYFEGIADPRTIEFLC